MSDPSELRTEITIPATPERKQWRPELCTTRLVLAGGGVLVVAILVLVLRGTLHNPGARNEDPQGLLSRASSMGPSSSPTMTSNCVIYERKETFSGSADYCRTRNSRLLNEEDTKTAAHCITRGEDFWAAPVSRNDGDCFIYNTDHGFVQMECLTPRWFICLQT
ncbi:uncharacterized protein LOC143808813 isoform X2 [Ranitomeya variabilis]|uniref:uncharacterized protein LOC143808813 isoform X2 n=1 Tax=Ranitomeya variabilis TaxID=490064 RepID=UPI0040560F65